MDIKDLRKKLGIDDYLELVKEDRNCHGAYISFGQYMYLLEKENQELKKQLEGRNLVDLGFYDNEPVGFKYDRNINKPVLACRCDNYYYAYPTKTGWVYYRSRYLGERDKEIEDMSFIDWAYAVLKEVETSEFRTIWI